MKYIKVLNFLGYLSWFNVATYAITNFVKNENELPFLLLKEYEKNIFSQQILFFLMICSAIYLILRFIYKILNITNKAYFEGMLLNRRLRGKKKKNTDDTQDKKIQKN